MIISGKEASENLYKKLNEQISSLNFTPKLVAVHIGENEASKVYLKIKEKKLHELGLLFELKKLPSNSTKDQIFETIHELNLDKSVSGIIVQLPLPNPEDEREILDKVDPKKDVDCLTSTNLGKFFVGSGKVMPATPLGVIRLLEYFNINLKGRKVCVIGRSNLVGKPLAIALLQKDSTVTICHSKTENLYTETKNSDIVISAVGNPKFLTKDYFSTDQILIDVGTSADADGKLSGDIDFENVKKSVQITPVPGGVGPMTVYGLIENLITLSKSND